jgi:hypothetical protein
MTTRVSVALETTPKRTFSSAVDWPGWARSGRTAGAALEALIEYADRYALVAARAGDVLRVDDLEFAVDETGPGNATTEFGAPGLVGEADRRPTSSAEADRLARLVAAAWASIAETAAAAPEELRRGPRGGGRDTSKILEHTLQADHAYARAMGLGLPAPAPRDHEAGARLRAAMLDLLRQPSDGSPLNGRKWPARYAAHRIAWHALDHAWEIQDRSSG